MSYGDALNALKAQKALRALRALRTVIIDIRLEACGKFNIYGHCIQIWSEHVCDELWRSSECSECSENSESSENSQSSQSPMRHWQWKLIETSIEVDWESESTSMEVSINFDSKSQSKFNLRWKFFFVAFFPVFLIWHIVFILNLIKSINVIHIIFTMSMTWIIITITVTVTWHIWSLWLNIY